MVISQLISLLLKNNVFFLFSIANWRKIFYTWLMQILWQR